MRALTLTQPWAGLVASGIKLVENRPRHMIKRDAVGTRFAIHASREVDADVYVRIRELAPELFRGPDNAEIRSDLPWYPLSRITSAVIAVATLDHIMDPWACGIGTAEPGAVAHLPVDQRRWFFGAIGYVLRDVRALAKPVPCRGWQGFWTLTPALAELVEDQIR